MEEKEAKLDDTSGFKKFEHYVEWILHQEAPDVISVFPPKSRKWKWKWMDQLMDWRSWPKGTVVCTVIVALLFVVLAFFADVRSTSSKAYQPPAPGIAWVTQYDVPQAKLGISGTESPDDIAHKFTQMYADFKPVQNNGPHGDPARNELETIPVSTSQSVIVVAWHSPSTHPAYKLANKDGYFDQSCSLQPGAELTVMGTDGARKLVKYQEPLPNDGSPAGSCAQGDMFFEAIG